MQRIYTLSNMQQYYPYATLFPFGVKKEQYILDGQITSIANNSPEVFKLVEYEKQLNENKFKELQLYIITGGVDLIGTTNLEELLNYMEDKDIEIFIVGKEVKRYISTKTKQRLGANHYLVPIAFVKIEYRKAWIKINEKPIKQKELTDDEMDKLDEQFFEQINTNIGKEIGEEELKKILPNFEPTDELKLNDKANFKGNKLPEDITPDDFI